MSFNSLEPVKVTATESDLNELSNIEKKYQITKNIIMKPIINQMIIY